MTDNKIDEALERNEQLGGSYFWEPEMCVVNLEESNVTDAGLVLLENLPSVDVLSLTSTAITDRGLTHFHGSRKLEVLSLLNTEVADEGIAQLLPNLTVNTQLPR